MNLYLGPKVHQPQVLSLLQPSGVESESMKVRIQSKHVQVFFYVFLRRL